jgi:hypothetical protein
MDILEKIREAAVRAIAAMDATIVEDAVENWEVNLPEIEFFLVTD